MTWPELRLKQLAERVVAGVEERSLTQNNKVINVSTLLFDDEDIQVAVDELRNELTKHKSPTTIQSTSLFINPYSFKFIRFLDAYVIVVQAGI